MPSLLLEKLRASLADGTFVKLTLSEPLGAEVGLRNIYGRLVELREGRRLSLVWRYATRDVTKNLPLDEAADAVGTLLREAFVRAHLFTTMGDWKWQRGHPLKKARATFSIAPEPEHDRAKVKALSAAPFLVALGVANPLGEARPGMAGKLRQIERFVEILGHLVADAPLAAGREIRVADLGAGRGYLTFATAEFFRRLKMPVRITGVEARAELVAEANATARTLGFSELEFVAGTIADFAPPEPPDVLIALHACDTATDEALHFGVRAGAALIVAAPCCHREVRAHLSAPAVLEPIFRHGILAEREAEVLTDALRALLLEMHGYKAGVAEFISPEHTGKNLMISAQRRAQPRDPEPRRAQFRELMAFHGLREQRLARLLGEL